MPPPAELAAKILAWPNLGGWLAGRLADGVAPAELMARTPVPLLWLVLPRDTAEPVPADPIAKVTAANQSRAKQGLPPYAPNDFLPQLRPA